MLPKLATKPLVFLSVFKGACVNLCCCRPRLADGVVFHTQVMVNPANTSEWIVFFNKDAGRSFFLVDAAEQVQTFTSLDALLVELRGLGIKRVEVQL